MNSCPRCGASLAAGQEYCLDCGLRLPGPGRLGHPPGDPRRLALPLALAAVLASAGAALAVGLTRESSSPDVVVTVTGGSVTQAVPAVDPKSRLAGWQRGTDAWTIVLLSVPKVQGRGAALARAEQARRRGLPRVGVLDSSRHPGLHPGYWVVFSGVYRTLPEATGALQRARTVQRAARTQRVTG
jgi:hypothetical protein